MLSVVSDSLQSHGLQHANLPCPSLFPSFLKLMSIEAIMPSTHLILCLPLLLLLSILPSIRVFSKSQFFTSGGQSIGASASVCPVHIQGSFPLGLTGLISVQSKGLWGVFSSTIILCNIHAFYIVTCILSCKNRIASLCPTQDTVCLGLVHGDDPERCYGEGGGRGVHVWERM